MADAVRFIKISKKDKNGVDKTPNLQSLSEITIPYSTGNIRYKILNITEKPSYFLYEVNNPNLEWADRAEVGYDFTGSIKGLYLDTFGGSETISSTSSITPISDPLNFITPQGYGLNTYTQKDIFVSATGSVHFEVESGTGGAITPRVRLLRINKDNTISYINR